MRNPARFQRILSAIGDINSSDIDRERHAEFVYAVCEDAACRSSWQAVLNSRSDGSPSSRVAAASDEGRV